MARESTIGDEDFCCPKCGAESGDSWGQCEGSCPIVGSPHYDPKSPFVPRVLADKTSYKGLVLPDGMLNVAMVNAYLGVAELAEDLVALWDSPVIQGMSRADRNAAIEETRSRLKLAVYAVQEVRQPPHSDLSAENLMG